jgi:lipopolysaccharide transport system permease protein
LDLVIALLLLIPMMLWYGVIPTAHIWLLPFAILLAVISALGLGLFFSALVVKFRDLQNVLPVLTQLMVFVTPVFYPASMVPSNWTLLYGLNPMAGAVQSFRWALFPSSSAPWELLLPGSIVAILLLVGGIAFFQRASRSFADWL